MSAGSDLVSPVIELAQAAAARILDIYVRGFDIQHKGDRSPLTEADLAAHYTIVAGLRRLAPSWPILSEEEAEIAYTERKQWLRYWLVDPLDGTRDFIKRNGEFTVNIALIERHRPVLGVIHVPVGGMTYHACAGEGAYRQEPGGTGQPIHTRPWTGGRLTVAGSRSHHDSEMTRFLSQFPDAQLVSLGSSLKSCWVADGQADVYLRLGPTSEWDTAAAQCILEEAGGRLTDLTLRPLCYNTKASLLNPSFIAYGDPQADWAQYLSAIAGSG